MGIRKQIVLISILIVSGFLVPVFYVWLTESSALTIRTIHVDSAGHAKAEELQVYVREFIGKPLYGTDLNRVRLLVERHPWVASASVRREPPSSLHIDVIERVPVGLIKQGKLWVVDVLGVQFKHAETEEELALPLIESVASAPVLVSHAAAGRPGGQVIEIQNMPHEQMRVLFLSGLEVVLSAKNSARQWVKLVDVLKSLGPRAGELSFVYLDDNLKRGQIAVRFKKG